MSAININKIILRTKLLNSDKTVLFRFLGILVPLPVEVVHLL